MVSYEQHPKHGSWWSNSSSIITQVVSCQNLTSLGHLTQVMKEVLRISRKHEVTVDTRYGGLGPRGIVRYASREGAGVV